jgi:hypothetical protein
VVGLDRLLLSLLAIPVPLASLLPFRNVTGTFGLFLSLVILWQTAGMWWGFAWLGVYFGEEILISSAREKRVLAERLRQAKIWFPDMTLTEQTAHAIAWTKSGWDLIEYELQNKQ